MKKYKIEAPIGSVVVPKEYMTETELREFLPSIVGDTQMSEVWSEIAKKDPIEDLLSYLERAGYSITEHETSDTQR